MAQIMSRVWRDAAEAVVAHVHASLPEDADLKARKRALRGAGWRAHQGTAWGRKMWGRVVREYLARYQPGLNPTDFPPTALDRANARLRSNQETHQ